MVERNIEREFIPLGLELGMGITVWSPLASGLLSGKYKPSEDSVSGEGRLDTLRNSQNSAFQKFTERNWKIVAELENVAKELAHTKSGLTTPFISKDNLPHMRSQKQDELKPVDKQG